MHALPARPRRVAAALAGVSTIGAYFEVSTAPVRRSLKGPVPFAGPSGPSGPSGPDDLAGFADPAGRVDPAGRPWRPLTALFTDLEALSARIADVGRRLDTAETRVAASILFQGLAARLWSPVVGVAVAHDLLVDLAPARVYWRPAVTGPLPLWVPRPAGWEVADPGGIAGPLYRNVMTELLEPLGGAVREITKIAPGLLRGNAASALAGTLRAITGERPELAGRAAALGRELLSLGVLRGRGELAEPVPGHHFFVRRGCCLYYRVPGGGKCGDCALLTPETRHEQWAHAVRQGLADRGFGRS